MYESISLEYVVMIGVRGEGEGRGETGGGDGGAGNGREGELLLKQGGVTVLE